MEYGIRPTPQCTSIPEYGSETDPDRRADLEWNAFGDERAGHRLTGLVPARTQNEQLDPTTETRKLSHEVDDETLGTPGSERTDDVDTPFRVGLS
jgi:hypothetical protein